jgi:hypothetical protein
METDQNLQAMPIIMPMVPICGSKFPTLQRLWVPWSLRAVRPMDYNSLESPPSPVQLAQCHPTLHYDSPLCRAVWISFLSAGVDRPLFVYVLKAKTWSYPILTSTHRQHCSLAIYCEYHPLTEGRPAYPFMETSISFDHSAWQFPEISRLKHPRALSNTSCCNWKPRSFPNILRHPKTMEHPLHPLQASFELWAATPLACDLGNTCTALVEVWSCLPWLERWSQLVSTYSGCLSTVCIYVYIYACLSVYLSDLV